RRNEVVSTVQPYNGEPRCIKRRRFSPAVFRSRLELKIPVSECSVCCVCVLFSLAKSMLRMESALSLGIVIFHREVIGQFHCKLFLSSENAKAEAIVAIVELVKPNGKR
ncbi:hypothetical protein pdam_00011519, partial [Pocillopora damicornis]